MINANNNSSNTRATTKQINKRRRCSAKVRFTTLTLQESIKQTAKTKGNQCSRLDASLRRQSHATSNSIPMPFALMKHATKQTLEHGHLIASLFSTFPSVSLRNSSHFLGRQSYRSECAKLSNPHPGGVCNKYSNWNSPAKAAQLPQILEKKLKKTAATPKDNLLAQAQRLAHRLRTPAASRASH